MISVVCVYNNEDILNDYLLDSLESQTADYELILIDNTENKFKSAAEALNHGGKKAKGTYIMFVHQDIDLSSDNWLKDTEKMLNSLTNIGILGVAGNCENVKGTTTIIKDGDPPKLAGPNYLNEITESQTLDECLIIVPKSVFNILHFDEMVCDDWHLYAADYCLSIKKLGYKVYIAPIFVYHLSPGYSMSENYYLTLNKILKKHRNNYNEIFTNTGCWNTLYPLKLQRKLIPLKLGFKKRLKLLTDVYK